MLLHWDDDRYHKLDLMLTVALVASIAAFLVAWYYEVIPYRLLVVSVVPVGLSHWYKRKLERLFKTYGGAYVTVESNKLTLSKPDQDFEKVIRFREIRSVKSGHWLLLEKMILSLNDGHEVVLINFYGQRAIPDMIKS